MKLVIQIPCLNEEVTLPETIRDLPRIIPGIDVVEILVIDDGSTDRTAEVARACGAHHVLSLGTRRGLARAFARGQAHAVALGADIIVNTDADNQYVGADIPKLIQPILLGQADMVVGSRPIVSHPEFSPIKKTLQLLGSWTLRQISQTTVRDAASGFRAYSRETSLRLFIYSRVSYCMETLIQAGNSDLRVASVDIGVNLTTRPSRLFNSIPEYIWKSGSTMVSMFILYRPSRFFGILSTLCWGAATALGLRFFYLVYCVTHTGPPRTYLPSLILLAILSLSGTLFAALAVLAELMRAQRKITEETIFLLRKARLPQGQLPSRDAKP